MLQYHPFHMVYLSPWPFYSALNLLTIFFFFVMMMGKKSFLLITIFCGALFIILFNWWRDVNRESSFQGYHTSFVYSNMRFGMIFFIVSEIFFFLSFFWSFFHSSLSLNYQFGNVWPPYSLEAVNPFDVPLLNTFLLLSSGVTVTLSHHYMIRKNNELSFNYLLMTVLLGIYFTSAQLLEYYQSDFILSDSSYGSCFFVATGFHGFHVIVGTILLSVSLVRLKKNFINFYHHVGIESSIWYWHFVDVIWLYLFVFIYWWVY